MWSPQAREAAEAVRVAEDGGSRTGVQPSASAASYGAGSSDFGAGSSPVGYTPTSGYDHVLAIGAAHGVPVHHVAPPKRDAGFKITQKFKISGVSGALQQRAAQLNQGRLR